MHSHSIETVRIEAHLAFISKWLLLNFLLLPTGADETYSDDSASDDEGTRHISLCKLYTYQLENVFVEFIFPSKEGIKACNVYLYLQVVQDAYI